ncbi:S8 family serine peptidase [Algoriphagus limi]|uniref:S8 family serine peptidase n=1 Tax=Algoriphagus limi TaxID=2975273 RepID=A0ABT2G5Q5_9BACT|nr:S8 family serine peptidase [Algoriphagus limi]MCS5490608.1 S8 family serine peptidase [Algoriphagus limi]
MFSSIKSYLKPSGGFLLGLILILGACSEIEQEVQLTALDEVAQTGEPEFIPGKYIVVLNDQTVRFRRTDDYESVQAGMRVVANSIAARHNIQEEKIERVYGNLLPGFSAELTLAQLSDLENDPSVRYVEPDGYVYTTTTQSNATWGIDRIDQASLPLDGTYTYDYSGQGVTAYILDTGIRTDHAEFGGRASQGFDAFGGDSEDCHGHGTHVAGTVGGSIYGVAKNVSLVAVRVLDCGGSGSWSGVIAGMDWVAANASGPSVANMSLGGGKSNSINDAVNRMYNAGVAVMVAAGNSNANACNYSPASAPNAYTVGATTSSDTRSSFSNYGDCVDIFAPGSSIRAAYYSSSTATATMSGTSMASPHVAGAAALYLESSPSASAQEVYDYLSSTAAKSVVSNSLSVNNDLVYTLGTPDNGGGGDPSDPTGIVLSAEGFKVKGRKGVNLSWSGNTGSVDIYRDGNLIASNISGSSYTYQTDERGGGSMTFKVCDAEGACSADVTVSF